MNRTNCLITVVTRKKQHRYMFTCTMLKFRHLNFKVLTITGLNVKNYKSHRFRIGAATTAWAKGFSEEQIQQMGRWNSKAFKKYIRIPLLSLILNTEALVPKCLLKTQPRYLTYIIHQYWGPCRQYCTIHNP
jgi:hypothetical protein